MKKFTFLLLAVLLAAVSCSKEEAITPLAETETVATKTDCVWLSPNNKVIPCEYKDKWQKYETEKRNNWNFTAYYCTLEGNVPGLRCESGGWGCTHAFSCMPCSNC